MQTVQPGDDGTGGYAPIAIVIGSTLRWVHGNHLGVPILYTSNTGAVIATPAYTLPGFPGQYRTFADLYYNQYRDYDPTTGRYIQADPIGLAGGQAPYLYAMGNPVRYTDPTGEYGIPGAAGAAAFNFGGQVLGNLAAGADLSTAIGCVDFGDVLVSAFFGFVGPGFLSNVIGGKPGWFGTTQAQNAALYGISILPTSLMTKQLIPPLRLGSDCECKTLGWGKAAGMLLQL